jgi:hypothetical protein
MIIRFAVQCAFITNAVDLADDLSTQFFNCKLKENILLLTDKRDFVSYICDCLNAEELDLAKSIDLKYLKEKVLRSKKQVIILNNFEHGFIDYETNITKVNLVEFIVYTLKKKSIIISSVNPLGGFKCTKSDEDPKKRTEMLNRWKDLLSGFISLPGYNRQKRNCTHIKFNYGNRSFIIFLGALFSNPHSSRFLINQELENETVCRFHPELLSIADDMKKINLSYDDLFGVIRQRTKRYFQFLWDSCSNEERLVLVRLAKDKFVSVMNLKTIESLFRRGLIRRAPNLKPVNTFFTHFILEANLYDEDFWSEQEFKSGWGLFQFPFLLVLLGILVFLFTTQKSIYESTFSLITGAATLIPALLNLLGSFSRKSPIKKEID